MLGIIFGLTAAIGQGFGYVLIKRSYKELPPSIAFALDAVFSLFLWIPFSLISGVTFDNFGEVFLIAVISAVLAEAYTMYIFSKGELSLTSAIFATYPAFTVLFSSIILGERFNTGVGFAIAGIIVGIVATSLPAKLNKKDFGARVYLLWPLSGAIAVGISDTISKDVIDKTDAATFLFALAFAQAIVALAYLKIERTGPKKVIEVAKDWRNNKDVILGSFFISSSLIAFWLTFEYVIASIASPLTALYAVAIVILAHFVLKEKLANKDKVAITLTFASTVILSILTA